MRLGDIVSVHKGKKPELVVAEPAPGYRRLIQIDDLRPGAKPKFCPQAQDEVLADPADIIIAWDGANAGASSFGLSGVVGSTLAILRPKRNTVSTAYVGHFVRAQRRYLRDRCNGATVPHIDARVLNGLEIPLPSLEEQRRIAEVLDRVEVLRAKRRAALAQLDAFPQALFHDHFGSPIANPKAWSSSTVGEAAEQVTDGEHLTPKRTMQGIKLLSARNIRSGHIDFENVDFISPEEHERIRRRCNPSLGDVLISCSGTIGRVASVETSEPFSLVRSVALIRPRTGVLCTSFLEHYLRTPALQARMLQRANASSQANLFQGQIRELPLFIPPLLLQCDFARRVAAVKRLGIVLRASSAELDALFAALQHRAFEREL